MDTLRSSNLDYWALGHIHKREVLSEENPMVVYPGNIQGRHFNETGIKGCSLVTVDQGKIIDHTLIPLSKVVYDYTELNVDGLESLSDFTSSLENLKSDLDKEQSFLVRIRLKGKTLLHSTFSDTGEMNALIQEINAQNNYRQRFVFIDKCINQTLPEIDLEERKESSDFIADLLQRFDDYQAKPEEQTALIEKLMEELSGSRAGRALSETNFKDEIQSDLESLLETAKWKCVAGLIQNQNES
jgi:DNA repair exonuclease SbcCD nuclease subunit